MNSSFFFFFFCFFFFCVCSFDLFFHVNVEKKKKNNRHRFLLLIINECHSQDVTWKWRSRRKYVWRPWENSAMLMQRKGNETKRQMIDTSATCETIVTSTLLNAVRLCSYRDIELQISSLAHRLNNHEEHCWWQRWKQVNWRKLASIDFSLFDFIGWEFVFLAYHQLWSNKQFDRKQRLFCLELTLKNFMGAEIVFIAFKPVREKEISLSVLLMHIRMCSMPWRKRRTGWDEALGGLNRGRGQICAIYLCRENNMRQEDV